MRIFTNTGVMHFLLLILDMDMVTNYFVLLVTIQRLCLPLLVRQGILLFYSISSQVESLGSCKLEHHVNSHWCLLFVNLAFSVSLSVSSKACSCIYICFSSCPHCCSWASSCKPKGCWFDSQSGHRPRLQPGPQVGAYKRLLIDVSLSH